MKADSLIKKDSHDVYGEWCDNVFVTRGEMMAVLQDGTLEIRGKGWGRRKRGDTELSDVVRVCKIGDVVRARYVAEALARILYAPKE